MVTLPASPPPPRPPLSLRIVPDVPVRQAATLELVDSEFMATALDARWQGPSPAAEVRRDDLLLIDPGQRRAGDIMQALAETTGAPLSRVRVLSPAALREVALLDEIRLPREPGLPCIVRHLQARRLEPDQASPALARVWQRTGLAVLLADGLPPEWRARWLLSVAALLRRLGDEGPPWLVLGVDPLSELGPEVAPWLARLHCVPVTERRSASATWNTVYQAWLATR